MKGAGVLFLTKDKTALFLKRGPEAPDFPGYWDFPGGTAEDGETNEETAVRESLEEIGVAPDNMNFHTRTRRGSARGVADAPPADAGAPVGLPVPSVAPEPITDAVDFTTFIAPVEKPFTPKLNDEHTGWAWAKIDEPPQPIHPSCQIALDVVEMDELGVARAIRDGRLPSPQKYKNMWLFAIRISGVDTAYRPSIDEFCYRPPETYLNDEFLARCNGLPVLFKRRDGESAAYHPEGDGLLNSEEFPERVVGTIFLPYIAAREVWGIAKIYDGLAASLMEEGKLSTSPAVWFKWIDPASKMTLDDGSVLLIEDKPALLDHVTLCAEGVWDKGDKPSGVRSESRRDSVMADEKEKETEKSKDDAHKRDDSHKDDNRDDAAKRMDAKLDACLDSMSAFADGLKSLGKRMDDADEERRKEKEEEEREDARRKDAAKDDARRRDSGDEEVKPESDKAEATVADAKRKDASEEEKKENSKSEDDARRKDAKRDDSHRDDKRDDSHRGDARADASVDAPTLAAIQKQISDLNSRIVLTKPPSDEDYYAVTDAQSRADEIFRALGERAPLPQPQETVGTYERRCVRQLKKYSPRWKDTDVNRVFADDASFGEVRKQVYADAMAAATSPALIPEYTMRAVEHQDGGHKMIEYSGHSSAWMNKFAGPVSLKGTGEFKTNNRRG